MLRRKLITRNNKDDNVDDGNYIHDDKHSPASHCETKPDTNRPTRDPRLQDLPDIAKITRDWDGPRHFALHARETQSPPPPFPIPMLADVYGYCDSSNEVNTGLDVLVMPTLCLETQVKISRMPFRLALIGGQESLWVSLIGLYHTSAD
ncbi:hypothetical protein PoB_005521200 [Plakobranchus ocellatus]|uniref:Uncharacterized protein n=1 Tax=Plakobranchus ocellatus TaxID=259542 RepID=A0AAV4CAZ9_9GAST|nr:hypothetical protein PoB_005521200 [Plakobranchus ocellatus]